MRSSAWFVLTLHAAQAALPSFLVFLVDDLGFADLGCFGSGNHSTPHIDAMREDGIKLTQWISAAPICTPSRAALQTGRLPRRYGMTANQLPWRVMTAPSQATGLPPTELTVASLLKQRGYSTGMSGKWHLGMSNATTKWAHLPRAHGYDSWLGTPFSNMHHCTQGTVDTEGRYFCLLMGNETVVQQPFKPQGMTDMLTRHAIDFLEFNARGGDYEHANAQPAAGAGAGAGAASAGRSPFFFLYSFLHVHTPLFSSPAFTNVSAGGRYGDNVEEMDDAVGRVLAALERLGMAGDTLVLLLSDNGPFAEEGWDVAGRTGGLKGSKGQTWEGGIRMPAVARWPGRIAANSSSDALVGTVDVLPTLMALAGGGVPADREYDGVDISSVLLAPEPAAAHSPHEWMFHWCGKNVTAVRHVARAANPAGAPVQRTYKLHFASQVWQTDDRPSPKCAQCCPYGPEAKFGHYDVMCECSGNALVRHDTPLVFSMDDDPQESAPLNRSTFPGGAAAFDLEVAAARAALRKHYDTIAPVPDQMHAQPNATLEPCCSGGAYVPNNDSFCRCDNYVPGKAYP